jgi:hypothetical protein
MEIEMFKNRFSIVLVIVALAVVGALIVEETIATAAVTSNQQVADAARWQAMGEYYQKQAEVQSLERSRAAQAARWPSLIDYYQRHPELRLAAGNSAEEPLPIERSRTAQAARWPSLIDYYQRHPELRLAVGNSVDTTDYFFRHP